MSKKVIFEYLALKVVDDIRNDCLPSDVALSMTNYPMNDYLRNKLRVPDDLQVVLRLMQKEDWRLKALGIMICRPFQGDSRIKKRLLSIWKSEGRLTFPLGFGCIYRLLEYEDVTNDHKDEFFEFIKENWNEWKRKLVSCYYEPKDIIQVAISRIKNPDFPIWKKWIYLIEMACSANSKQAEETVRDTELKGQKSGDAVFTEAVKKWLLENALSAY